MLLYYSLSFVTFLSLCLAQGGEPHELLKINFASSDEHTSAQIRAAIPVPLMIKTVEVSSDINFGKREWDYLTEIVDGSSLTAEKLCTAVALLKRKNKFETVRLSQKSRSDGVHLVVELSSFWTLSKVELQGALVDKDRLLHYYAIHPGDLFDPPKHQYSIEKIEQLMKDQGYFSVSTIDSFEYDSSTKSVVAVLDIKKNQRYKIARCAVQLAAPAIEATDRNRLSEKLHTKFLSALEGACYSKAEIDEKIKQLKEYLSQKGYYPPQIEISLNLDKEKAHVDLTLSIRVPAQKRFVFFGNHAFSQEILSSELLVTEITTLMPAYLLAQELLSFYRKHGYWSASIECKEEPHRSVFLITEGAQAVVREVKITGGRPTDTQFFDPIVRAGYYQEELFKSCLDDLMADYQRQGFWDCELVTQEYKVLEPGEYQLTLTLEPGQQRLLKKLTIGESDTNYLQPFASLKNLKEPIPFESSLVAQLRKALAHELLAQGLKSKITHELIEHPDGLELKLNYDAQQRMSFGKTVIWGSSHIDPQVLMSELCYKQGEPYDKKKVEQTVARLKSLGVFESVALTPSGDGSSQQTMLLKALPDSPFEVRVRLGYQQISNSFAHNSQSTYKAGGSLLWKNPFNRADQIRFDADFTRFSRDISLEYRLPSLLSIPVRTTFQAYSTVYEQPICTRLKQSLYKANNDGLGVIVQSSQQWGTATLDTGLELQKISGISTRHAEQIHFAPALIDKRIIYLYAEPTLTIDYTDQQTNPTLGGSTVLFAKGMYALNRPTASFLKVILEQSLYYPLYKRSVIGAFRLRLGHIFHGNFATLVPPERFYLGGPNTIRAYEPDLVPPITPIKIDGSDCWVPIGGKTMANINMEVRFPLYKQLSGVVFNDMGILAQTPRAVIEGNKWIGATGFGVRYDTPVGPVRFDIGFKWHKRRPDDRSYAWYLTFGHAF